MTARNRPSQRPLRPAAAQRQRGAVAVFVAAGLVALVASLLFVIDIGRLYYAQRQLQLDANMAALAGAQAVAGCLADSKGVPGNQDAITTAVLLSLEDNTPGPGATGGTAKSIAYLGTPEEPVFQTGDSFSAASLNPAKCPPDKLDECTLVSAVEVGQTVLSSDGITRTLKPLAIGEANVDSVRVTLAAAQPHSFLMGFMGGGGSTKVLHASATAQRANVGSFSIGTGALALDTGQAELLNPLLSGLLGAKVQLDFADYQKLLGTSITLAQLSSQLGLAPFNSDGSLGPLLTSNLPIAKVNELLQAIGDKATPGLLSNIVVPAAQGSLRLEQILGLGETVSSTVASLPINAMQLLLAAAESVGRGRPLALPVSVDLGPLAKAGVYLTVGQPPQIGIGPPGRDAEGHYYAMAKSAQVNLTVRDSALELLGSSVKLGLDVQVAQATAGLDTLACPSGDAQITGKPNLVVLRAGTFSGSATDISPVPALEAGSVIAIKVLFVPVLTVDLSGVAEADSGLPSGVAKTFSPPYPSESQRVASGLDLRSLTADLTTDFLGKLTPHVLGRLPLPLGDILSQLGGLLTPLVGVLSNTAVEPLLQLLGVQLGYADIVMLSVQQAPPLIVTNCLPGVAPPNGCLPVLQ